MALEPAKLDRVASCLFLAAGRDWKSFASPLRPRGEEVKRVCGGERLNGGRGGGVVVQLGGAGSPRAGGPFLFKPFFHPHHIEVSLFRLGPPGVAPVVSFPP